MVIGDAILAGRPLPVPVIDAHTHLGPYQRSGWYQYQPSTDAVVRCMDRYGIDTVVTAPHAFLGGYQDLANDITRKLIAGYPGRIWGYIVVNPCWSLPRIEAEIGKYIDRAGFVGFKLLPGYQGPLLSAGNEAVFAAAEQHRMPVLSHTWHRDPPARDFEAALRKYPHVPLLAGHCGGHRETYREFIALSKDYPRLCLEICGSLNCDWWFEDIVAEAGADRLFFGTDLINCEPRYEIGRVGLAAISDADKKKIFAENFLRIVGKNVPAPERRSRCIASEKKKSKVSRR